MAENTSQGLIKALKFVLPAQKNGGDKPFQTHCLIDNGMLKASDGTLTISSQIEETLTAYPQTKMLHDVLVKCSEATVMTQTSGAKLVIKSGKIKANIPCYKEGLTDIYPDEISVSVTEEFQEAISKIQHLGDTDSDILVRSSLLLDNCTVTCTDGNVILQAWHGLNMPTSVIPIRAARLVSKASKLLTGVGFSSRSVTFHFEDCSWIKTQLMPGQYPQCDRLFDDAAELTEIPEDFFANVKLLKPFGFGAVYFVNGGFSSTIDPNDGVFIECEQDVTGVSYYADKLLSVADVATAIDFKLNNNCCFVFGEKLRGVIMGFKGAK